MSGSLNVKNFTRPDKDLIERLKEFTVPELCDGAGLYHSMDYRIKPQIGRTRIVGPALPVDVPSGEGGIVADAILFLQEGDVLVVAGKGNCACSYWGDHRSLCDPARRGRRNYGTGTAETGGTKPGDCGNETNRRSDSEGKDDKNAGIEKGRYLCSGISRR